MPQPRARSNLPVYPRQLDTLEISKQINFLIPTPSEARELRHPDRSVAKRRDMLFLCIAITPSRQMTYPQPLYFDIFSWVIIPLQQVEDYEKMLLS
jgi:hypothetical protein